MEENMNREWLFTLSLIKNLGDSKWVELVHNKEKEVFLHSMHHKLQKLSWQEQVYTKSLNGFKYSNEKSAAKYKVITSDSESP